MTPLFAQPIQFGRMHFSEIKSGKVVFTDNMPAPIKSHVLHYGLRNSERSSDIANLIDVNLVVYNANASKDGGRHRAETFTIDEQGFVDGISEYSPPRIVAKRGVLRRLLEFFGATKTVVVNNTPQ